MEKPHKTLHVRIDEGSSLLTIQSLRSLSVSDQYLEQNDFQTHPSYFGLATDFQTLSVPRSGKILSFSVYLQFSKSIVMSKRSLLQRQKAFWCNVCSFFVFYSQKWLQITCWHNSTFSTTFVTGASSPNR